MQKCWNKGVNNMITKSRKRFHTEIKDIPTEKVSLPSGLFRFLIPWGKRKIILIFFLETMMVAFSPWTFFTKIKNLRKYSDRNSMHHASAFLNSDMDKTSKYYKNYILAVKK